VRVEMRGILAVGFALAAAWTLAGCGGSGPRVTPQGSASEGPGETPVASGSERAITGTEALELYGVDVNDPPTPGPATGTPQIWFPAKAWVEPSVLPYDPNETINFLPMFSRPELDAEGTWLGDLESGRDVILHAVSEDGTVCLVEGPVLQGWTTKGWVACNRLRFSGPG
jgi:hypothetical protein